MSSHQSIITAQVGTAALGCPVERSSTAGVFAPAEKIEESLRRRALEAGALGFLHKPFDAEEMLELIRLALVDR